MTEKNIKPSQLYRAGNSDMIAVVLFQGEERSTTKYTKKHQGAIIPIAYFSCWLYK